MRNKFYIRILIAILIFTINFIKLKATIGFGMLAPYQFKAVGSYDQTEYFKHKIGYFFESQIGNNKNKLELGIWINNWTMEQKYNGQLREKYTANWARFKVGYLHKLFEFRRHEVSFGISMYTNPIKSEAQNETYDQNGTRYYTVDYSYLLGSFGMGFSASDQIKFYRSNRIRCLISTNLDKSLFNYNDNLRPGTTKLHIEQAVISVRLGLVFKIGRLRMRHKHNDFF